MFIHRLSFNCNKLPFLWLWKTSYFSYSTPLRATYPCNELYENLPLFLFDLYAQQIHKNSIFSSPLASIAGTAVIMF